MTERENYLLLFEGRDYDHVPIWLMGFESEDVTRRLNPGIRFPDNLAHNPESGDYPWDRLSDDERRRVLDYNRVLHKPVVVAGWGANMPLGHGGPGEFHFRLVEVNGDERILECETGAKRVVRKNPHFYRDFDYPMKSAADVGTLRLPDPRDPARWKGFAEDVAFFKENGYIAGGNLNGFFSGPHYFCLGYQEFLVSLLAEPEDAKRLIDRIGEWNIAAAEEMMSRGVECIILCDDLGSSDNLLISPELYKAWILPWHRRLCDMAHEYGARVHLHSHGNITKILPLVLSTGVDMIDPFDIYEHMDLVAFLEEHRGCRTVPVGGCHKFFFDWDRDRQNDYLTDLFGRAKKAGRWMFMDTGGIPETVTKETYEFLLERLVELSRL